MFVFVAAKIFKNDFPEKHYSPPIHAKQLQQLMSDKFMSIFGEVLNVSRFIVSSLH
uniref:Uncharacterized protein n=1 Tax=mine drainage metagenome TaxID=410659 RepID=E6QV38_9ZZZZ